LRNLNPNHSTHSYPLNQFKHLSFIHQFHKHHVPNFITYTKNLNHLQCNPSLQKSPTISYSHTIYSNSTYHIHTSKYHHNFNIFNSSKTDIFNIQLVHIYKTTYIFCKSIIHKNNNFSVSRILTLVVRITSSIIDS
jgi:hypothetical protein